MRRLVVLGIVAVLTGLLVGVVVASSGDDGGGGGGDQSQSVPDLAPLPGSSDLGSGSDTRSERTDTDRTTTDDSGGADAPQAPPADTGGNSGGSAQPQDSPQNDTPPPSGSPAERFEQFCQENPGAC
jgi:hypothetical protein